MTKVSTTAILIGATGRMGAAIVRETFRMAGKSLEVVAAVASPGSKSLGLDVGEVAGVKALGVRVVDELPPDLAKAQVAIDFSRPDLSLRALNVCRAARVPIVIGTTGHGSEFEARIAAVSRDIAVLVAPNTSIGVAVAQELVPRWLWPKARPGHAVSIHLTTCGPDGPGRVPGAKARSESQASGLETSWVPIQCCSPAWVSV